MNRIIILILLVFPFPSSAQHKGKLDTVFNKYAGIWVDTASRHRYKIVVKSDSIHFTSNGENHRAFKLLCKQGKTWFRWSKTEWIELFVSDNRAFLQLDFKSSKERYPIGVPYLTCIRYKRVSQK